MTAERDSLVKKEEVDKVMHLRPQGMQVPMAFIAKASVDAVLELPEVQEALLKECLDINKEYKVYVTDKFGCDGFQSKALYNQRGPDGEVVDDHHVFVSEYIPINMAIVKKDGTIKKLWHNCLCNSAYACRPLR